MKIKDLPQPIKELALKRQVEQGNEPNEELELGYDFIWDKTPEGGDFWSEIFYRNFKPFYDLYPQGVEISKDDFAIGFLKWYMKIMSKMDVKYIEKTVKELLEIYKKEQENGN